MKSDGAKILEAAQVLSACRQRGALVLRVCGGLGGEWQLYVLNGHAVPEELQGRLLELQPSIMMLLRRLAT